MPNPLESFLNLNIPSMNDEVKEELSNKFLCPQKFAQDIEQIVKISKVNYIDAIVSYCEQNSIEIDTVSKLVSKRLRHQ
jgi:hypothetical protein